VQEENARVHTAFGLLVQNRSRNTYGMCWSNLEVSMMHTETTLNLKWSWIEEMRPGKSPDIPVSGFCDFPQVAPMLNVLFSG
jgi:hypothetical protein